MYRAKRFIDKFQPGDIVPDDAYTAEHFAAMIKLGMVVSEGEDVPEPKQAPAKRVAKKAAPKKSASSKQ